MKATNVIFGATDAKYGDFTIHHWLKSLQENCDLSRTDVVILDYGMTKAQLAELKKTKAKVLKCKRDGFVTNIRFRDIANYLKKHKYAQAMAADAGDIIFQADISPMFEKYRTEYRAATEDYFVPFESVFTIGNFSRQAEKELRKELKGKKMINCGVMFAPVGKFIKLCNEMDKMMLKKTGWGPDQIITNFEFYRDGFKDIGNSYNFVLTSCESDFEIKDGVFYFPNGEKIPIVHNAGGTRYLRPVKNFGYGTGHNQLKRLTYKVFRKCLKFGHKLAMRKKPLNPFEDFDFKKMKKKE